MLDISQFHTEANNPKTCQLHQMAIPEILGLMNQEDQQISLAIGQEINNIAVVVEHVVATFQNQGRLFLCGAGTSGRLAVMEASECPPTFSTPPQMIQGIMAGAPQAFWEAVEGAEDNQAAGIEAAQARQLNSNDFVIGISASGRTPYVLGFLSYARQVGAGTAFLVASPPKEKVSDFLIFPKTGPEVVTGSTRLKAGTAAKMVLNMITTTAMVQIGKVYGNWMVDVHPTNEKLVARAARIVSEITGCPIDQATSLVLQTKNPKVAIVMYLKQVSQETALRLLDQHHGQLRALFEKPA